MGSGRGFLGRSHWNTLPYPCHAGRHISVRGLYSSEKPHLDRVQAPCEVEMPVRNVDRSVGAMLSGEIALKDGSKDLLLGDEHYTHKPKVSVQVFTH